MRIKILKPIALALVCVSAAPVYASEWQMFKKVMTDDSYWFFDRATVSKQGGVVTVWIKSVQDLTQPDSDGSYSTAYKNVYVCSKRTFQRLTYSTYDEDGKFISGNSNRGRATDITPDAINEGILEVICTADFPSNKSRELYYPAINNDPFKHGTGIFMWSRAQKIDLAPK
jgi:hypothetical protein